VERHVALADGPELHLDSLPTMQRGEVIDSDTPSLEELERRYIRKLLEKFAGNREKDSRHTRVSARASGRERGWCE